MSQGGAEGCSMPTSDKDMRNAQEGSPSGGQRKRSLGLGGEWGGGQGSEGPGMLSPRGGGAKADTTYNSDDELLPSEFLLPLQSPGWMGHLSALFCCFDFTVPGD